jgi:cation-transporting ATPase E
MGWDLGSGEGLTVLRATNAIIVFVLGIAVLVTVSRPLNSWRGLLVVGFAAAGVIGACIPMVANFFALRMPHGATLIATLIAIVAALSIFVLCQSTAGIIRRIARKCGGKRQRVEEQDA